MQLNNAMNTIMNAALTDVMGALFKLDEAGATVVAIFVENRNPIIWVDSDGPRGLDNPRVTKTVTVVDPRSGSTRRNVMVMRLGNVQVQWFVDELAVRAAS